MIEYNDIKYELIEDYKHKFDKNEVKEFFTDFYKIYDYVLGDYFAGRVRLKGFYDNSNKKANKSNNYKNIKDYITNYCSYDCAYFILKKIK